MHKLVAPTARNFKELSTESFDDVPFSVYILNKEWAYLYVNHFVENNLGRKREDLLGKNMWEMFPELKTDPIFNQIKSETEAGKTTNYITISPLTLHRLNIVGLPLEDCYFFTASILPNKDALLNELRVAMNK